jgi:hypothetical protein
MTMVVTGTGDRVDPGDEMAKKSGGGGAEIKVYDRVVC